MKPYDVLEYGSRAHDSRKPQLRQLWLSSENLAGAATVSLTGDFMTMTFSVGSRLPVPPTQTSYKHYNASTIVHISLFKQIAVWLPSIGLTSSLFFALRLRGFSSLFFFSLDWFFLVRRCNWHNVAQLLHLIFHSCLSLSTKREECLCISDIATKKFFIKTKKKNFLSTRIR